MSACSFATRATVSYRSSFIVRQCLHAGLLLILLLLAACDSADTRQYTPAFTSTPNASVKEYIFGVHPQRNPKKLRAVFGPLVNYINAQLPDAVLIFEASRNYAAYDEKQAKRQFDFVLPNQYGTIQGIDSGYKVFAQMGNVNDARGLIVVRRDSDIKTVADLKGKKLSFPAPTALAATMLPKYFLYTQGLNVKTDFESVYVGSMESSLMNIYRGDVAAGTTYPPAWRDFNKLQPEIAAELKIIWETDVLPDVSVMARNDVPADLVARVAQIILTMHTTEQGRVVLQAMDLTQFKAASDADYAPVRRFLKQYETNIGPVK